jgi:hypothetical protein
MVSRIVARLMLAQYETVEALEATVAYVREAGFNGVMIMNCRGHCEPAHYTPEQTLERAELMRRAMARFREEGFAVSLNNLATVGMNLSPPAKHDFGIQPLIDPDGQVFSECFCPEDVKFLDYLDYLFSTWASLDPDEIWVDDDFRYKNKVAQCFCPLHLRQLDLVTGKKWEREELAAELKRYPPGSTAELPNEWSEIQKNSLLGAARCIAGAVHKVKPGTSIGLMGITVSMHHYGAAYLAELLRIFNPNGPALVRPEFGAYSDAERVNWSAYAPRWACQRAFGDEFTALPEFETFPGTQFNHSHRALRMKYQWGAVHGFRHAAESTMWGTPRFEPEFTAYQRGNFAQYEHIGSVMAHPDLQPQGVNLELTQDRAGNNGAPDIMFMDSLAPMMVGRLGIPLWPNGGHATYLTGNSPLSNIERWDEVAAGGLVLDRGAFDTLLAAGRTDLLGGVETKPMPGIPAWESFEAVPENGLAGGDILSMENATARRADMDAFVLPDNDSIRVWSWFEDEDGNRLSPATWSIEAAGKRIVVLPFSMNDGSSVNAIANWKRKSQLENLLEWAARKPLPVTLSGAADLCCVYRESKKRDRIVLALANFSNDPADNIALTLPLLEEWQARRVRVLGVRGDWEPVALPVESGPRLGLLDFCVVQPMSVRVLEIRAV